MGKIGQLRNNGKGLKFDGNDVIRIPHSDSLNVDYVTMEAIIKLNTSTTLDNIIINKESSYEIAIDGNTNELIAAVMVNGNWAWKNSGIIIPLNKKVFIAVSYDGTDLKFAIRNLDTGEIQQGTSIEDIGIINDSTMGLGLGARGVAGDGLSGGNSFIQDGILYSAMIWNIPKDFNKMIADSYGIGENTTGLIGYWLLNEGNGKIANDITPNVNHGTIDGAIWIDEGIDLNLLLSSEAEEYPFANLSFQTKNTINKLAIEGNNAQQDWSKWSHWGNRSYWQSEAQFNDSIMGKVFQGTSSGATTYLYDYYPYNVKANQPYTISFYLKADIQKTIIAGAYIVKSIGGQVTIGSESKSITLTTDWQRFDFTVIPSESVLDNTAGFGLRLYNGIVIGDIIYAALPQFEEGHLSAWVDNSRKTNNIIAKEIIEEKRPLHDITSANGISGDFEDSPLIIHYGDGVGSTSYDLVNGWSARTNSSPVDEYLQVLDVENAPDGPRVYRLYDNGSSTWKAFTSIWLTFKSTKWYRISAYARIVEGQGTKYAYSYLPYFGTADNQSVTWTASELTNGDWIRKYTIFQPSIDDQGGIYLYGHYGTGIVEYDGIIIEEFDSQPIGEPPKLRGIFLENGIITIRGGELVEGVDF